MRIGRLGLEPPRRRRLHGAAVAGVVECQLQHLERHESLSELFSP